MGKATASILVATMIAALAGHAAGAGRAVSLSTGDASPAEFLRVAETDRSIAVDNGSVRVHLVRQQGRVVQEFAARRGGEWVTA